MQLKKINYYEYQDQKNEWHLNGLTFQKINLIVGKNSVGKSRTINVINGLANLLSVIKKLPFKNGNYDVLFSEDNKDIQYKCHYANHKVQNEELIIDKTNYLSRGNDGIGEIYFEEQDAKLKFQTPSDELAILARRDSIQHPFLEDTYNWGKNAMLFQFGQKMGQDTLSSITQENKLDFNIKETQQVILAFIVGKQTHQNKFVNAIISDMNKIGFNISDIFIKEPSNINLLSNNINLANNPLQVIAINEENQKYDVEQMNMSQGMFRTLSLIIQINYYLFMEYSGTILIDDIGEGLDYDRSTSLINVLISKVNKSDIQLIMTTNDQFIMNKVPIEYWSILVRNGSQVNCINYENSKKIFDEFYFTGLNNFDFFSMAFYKLHTTDIGK